MCVGIGLILRYLTFPTWIILPLVPILSLYSTLPSLGADYLFAGIGSPNLSHFTIHLIILSFGLAVNRMIISSCFLSALLISVHPLFGSFFFIIVILYFLQTILDDKFNHNQRTKILKKSFTGILLGISVTLISFITYFVNSPTQNFFIDQKNLNIYIENWDIHRNVIPELSAIIIGLFIGITFLFLNFVFLRDKKVQFRSFQNSLSLGLVISCLIYLISIAIPESNFQNLLIRVTPGRFMILNGLFTFFLIVSFIIQLGNSIASMPKIKIYSCLIFLIILLLILILNQDFEPFFSHNYSILSITSILVLLIFGTVILFWIFKYLLPFISLRLFKLSQNKILFSSTILINSFLIYGIFFNSIKTDDNLDFQCELASKKTATLVATEKDGNNLLRICQKLIVFNPRYIDFVPYAPSTINKFIEIITIIYGFDFYNPPEELRQSGRLVDDNQEPLFKDLWELRSKKEWNAIRNKTGILEIATPDSWTIDLEKRYTINDSVIYSLE